MTVEKTARTTKNKKEDVKMSKQNCSLEFKTEGERLVVLICGEIDHYGAVSVRVGIDGEISRLRPRATVLDLSAIDFMDSSGIGLIMGRYAKMQSIGGELIIRSPSERVEKIIKLAGLLKIVKIENGGEEI